MNDDDIYDIGMTLEENGLNHAQIDAYFEHAGVRGMKWGVRKKRYTSGDVNSAVNKATLKSIKAESRNQRRFNRLDKKADKREIRNERAIVLVASGAAFMASRRLMLRAPVAALVVGGAAVGTRALLDKNN